MYLAEFGEVWKGVFRSGLVQSQHADESRNMWGLLRIRSGLVLSKFADRPILFKRVNEKKYLQHGSFWARLFPLIAFQGT